MSGQPITQRKFPAVALKKPSDKLGFFFFLEIFLSVFFFEILDIQVIVQHLESSNSAACRIQAE